MFLNFIYFLVGFISSIAGSISGIGGGLITKPVFGIVSSFDIQTINFLSGNTVLAMTVATLFNSRKSAIKLDKRISSILVFGGIVGGLGGKYLFYFIRQAHRNDQLVGATQWLLMILLVLGVLLLTFLKKKIRPLYLENILGILSIGIILGGLASFLGIGGGPANLIILFLFFSMDTKTAARNSIYIIFVSQLTSLIYTFISGNIPQFPLSILFFMILGGMSGGVLGTRLSEKMSIKQVDIFFRWMMILIIVLSSYNFFVSLG